MNYIQNVTFYRTYLFNVKSCVKQNSIKILRAIDVILKTSYDNCTINLKLEFINYKILILKIMCQCYKTFYAHKSQLFILS